MMTTDEAIDVLRRVVKFWSNQDDDGPSDAEATQALAVTAMVIEDVRVAAGECRVSVPSPGTDAARLLTANAMLRRALQRAEQDAIEARAEESEQRAQAADWRRERENYAHDAGAYPYMRAEVIRLKAENARLGDEFSTLNGHVAEAQELLLREGAECGADGSLVVGIGRLVEQRDELRAASSRLREVVALLEWSGSDLRLECVLCHRLKEKGHLAECLIAQTRVR